MPVAFTQEDFLVQGIFFTLFDVFHFVNLRMEKHIISIGLTELQLLFLNKNVLLRERKRHTDRGVSSTNEVGYTPPAGVPPPR